MTETKITTKSGSTYTFFSIENAYCGAPRYVVHHRALLSDAEREGLSILDGVNLAQKRGCFKYRGKKFGGCIGVSTYNLYDYADELERKKGYALALTKTPNLDRLCDEIYAYIMEYIDADREYLKTLKHIYNNPVVTWCGEQVYDAGLKYATCGEFMCNIELERNLLVECGYKADKWSCDRVIKKIAEAAGMVLEYICKHFKF